MVDRQQLTDHATIQTFLTQPYLELIPIQVLCKGVGKLKRFSTEEQSGQPKISKYFYNNKTLLVAQELILRF